MATKKRLSDLLREEMQKSPGSEPKAETTPPETADGSPEPEADPVASADSVEAKPEVAVAELAELAELKVALAAAQQREAKLQQSIAELHAQVERVPKLQDELEHAQQQLRQFSEANQKLTQSLETQRAKPSQQLVPRPAYVAKGPPSFDPKKIPSTDLTNETIGWVD